MRSRYTKGSLAILDIRNLLGDQLPLKRQIQEKCFHAISSDASQPLRLCGQMLASRNALDRRKRHPIVGIELQVATPMRNSGRRASFSRSVSGKQGISG